MSPQDLLLCVLPLQDWTEVRLGQGVAHADSSMSLGSPALGSSLVLALKVRTHPGTPSTFGGQEELPRGAVEEEEEEMDAAENDDADQAKD